MTYSFGYKKLIDSTKFILVLPTFPDTTAFIKDQMMNEKFTICFEVSMKWNLIKTHNVRLKSTKYKSHVIKEQLSK